jgi:hypothetical protein
VLAGFHDGHHQPLAGTPLRELASSRWYESDMVLTWRVGMAHPGSWLTCIGPATGVDCSWRVVPRVEQVFETIDGRIDGRLAAVRRNDLARISRIYWRREDDVVVLFVSPGDVGRRCGCGVGLGRPVICQSLLQAPSRN